MPKFNIEIRETLSKIVEVEADNEDEAIDRVRKEYYDQEHVLDSDNYIGTEFEIYNP